MCGLLVLAALAVLFPGQGLSGPESTVEEIVARHLEALGGSQKIAAIKSMKKTGTYVYNGIQHPIVSYHKSGRKMREEIQGLRLWGTSVWAGHSVVRGTNGTVAWNKDDSRPQEWQQITEARARLMMEEADIHGALYDFRNKGHRIELIGRGDLDGTPVHTLKVSLASGLLETWYLELKSFLLLRIEVETKPTDGDLERPRAWHFDDYRPVQGVLMPFWVSVEEPLFSREYTFKTIVANVDIEDSIFEPPRGSFRSPPGSVPAHAGWDIGVLWPWLGGRRDLPRVDDSAVHVDEADVVRDLVLGPDLGIRVVAERRVIRDQDVAAIALAGLVDGGPGGKDGGISQGEAGKHKADQCSSQHPCGNVPDGHDLSPLSFDSSPGARAGRPVPSNRPFSSTQFDCQSSLHIRVTPFSLLRIVGRKDSAGISNSGRVGPWTMTGLGRFASYPQSALRCESGMSNIQGAMVGRWRAYVEAGFHQDFGSVRGWCAGRRIFGFGLRAGGSWEPNSG